MYRKLCRLALRPQSQKIFSTSTRCVTVCESAMRSCSLNNITVLPLQVSHFSTKNSKQINPEKTQEQLKKSAAEIQAYFKCSETEAETLAKFLLDHSDRISLSEVKKTVKWLIRMRATFPVIYKNIHLLLVPLNKMKLVFERISRSEWHSADDFIPFLKLSEAKVKRLQLHNRHIIRDRIYLLQDYFKTEAHLISHACAKHSFVIQMEEDLLLRKLTMLLHNGVLPENILNDMDVLARDEEIIKEQLEYIKTQGIQHLMPWMIKCEEYTLLRNIEINQSRNTEQNKTLGVLIKRLNLHGGTANSIFRKYSFLHGLNHRAVSEILDELLKIFTTNEILSNLELLSHPIMHVKIRVNELIALKNTDIPPRVLNWSERKFNEYLNGIKKK